MLQENIIAIYCLVDDLLKTKGHFFDSRAKINDSELITIAIVAALWFGGNWQQTFHFFYSFGLINNSIHKSRICRRMAALDSVIEEFTDVIGHVFIDIRADKEYILDSAPFAVCDNIRIPRSRMLFGEEFRGYIASFKRYFYGLRLQLITTKEGIPVTYIITEGKLSDASTLALLPFEMSAESKIYADAAYTDYDFEDTLQQQNNINILTQRKKNTKRVRPKCQEQTIKKHRKKIETAFSLIKSMLKRRIHAVKIETFMLKLKCFILAQQLKMII
jgi:hypothetical protein